MIKPSPPFWERYRQLQDRVAASSTENIRSRGADDALTALLTELDHDRELDDLQVDRLRENRSAKHRHHLRADMLMAEAGLEDTGLDGETRYAARETLSALTDQLSALEWGPLGDLANGYSYAETACRRKVSLEALKSRVCRLRQRLRAANEDLDLLLVA